jgi:DNA repair protein RadA/Sms
MKNQKTKFLCGQCGYESAKWLGKRPSCLSWNSFVEEKRRNINEGLRFGITKWLYVGVNIEDIAYKTAVTPYIKIAIDDEDLAAFLGIINIAAVSTK